MTLTRRRCLLLSSRQRNAAVRVCGCTCRITRVTIANNSSNNVDDYYYYSNRSWTRTAAVVENRFVPALYTLTKQHDLVGREKNEKQNGRPFARDLEESRPLGTAAVLRDVNARRRRRARVCRNITQHHNRLCRTPRTRVSRPSAWPVCATRIWRLGRAKAAAAAADR